MIRFEHVSKRYASGTYAVQDLNLEVASGQLCALVGPSGGGKTTFSKLLTGELKPTHGSILIGGLDAQSVSGPEWRTRVAAAPQFHENHIFSNTTYPLSNC